MADLADVETALKSLIVGWCYPAGTTQPSAIPAAPKIKVGRGWPLKDTLQADLAANTANVSVYSQPGSERLTTRYPREWQSLTPPTHTITATVAASTITLGGAVSAPQNVAVIVNRQAYIHAVQAGDTLAAIAAALAAAISVDTPATSSGPLITIPAAHSLVTRVGGVGATIRELRRQVRLFQISVWTSTPEQRDALAGFIDSKFAGAGAPNGLEFITLPDGSAGRLQYVRTAPTDKDELSGSWRRDLIYSVEYATTETSTAAEVVDFAASLPDITSHS